MNLIRLTVGLLAWCYRLVAAQITSSCLPTD
jgi:hypothetical protein